MPTWLSDVGIPRETIPELSEKMLKINRLITSNPRKITEEDAKEIFEKCGKTEPTDR